MFVFVQEALLTNVKGEEGKGWGFFSVLKL
jgi:hypothetical protein